MTSEISECTGTRIPYTMPDTDANILLVQEAPLLDGTPPTLDDFHCFLSNKQACRTVTYMRNKAFKSTSSISDPHADFLVVMLTLHSKDRKPPTINIANCYNRLQNRKWRTREQPTHSLHTLVYEIFTLADPVAGDMNKHHPRWVLRALTVTWVLGTGMSVKTGRD